MKQLIASAFWLLPFAAPALPDGPVSPLARVRLPGAVTGGPAPGARSVALPGFSWQIHLRRSLICIGAGATLSQKRKDTQDGR